MSPCQRCLDRGQTWDGSAPKCAFPLGLFDADNWNCATMNAIRDIADDSLASETLHAVWSEDQYAAVLPWEGRFVVLSWYKRRGRTEGAWLLEERSIALLTLGNAEDYLAFHG